LRVIKKKEADLEERGDVALLALEHVRVQLDRRVLLRL